MKGLVVGLGSIGRRHARNWVSLGLGPLAICRRPPPALPQPEPLGVEATLYHDLDEALERERPDVVLVTNPTSLHVPTACEAIKKGAHVFVEKPLGDSMDGVADLIEAAAATKRIVMVAYNLRFHPLLGRMKELIEQEAVGRIVSARAEVGEFLPDWHPWEDYRASYSGRRELGGGAVLTFSHELDAVYWLLGEPKRITALATHASSLEIDTEDVADIILQFESGALASVHMDYLRRPPGRMYEIVGEEGVLRLDWGSNRLEIFSTRTGQWRVEQGDPRFDRNDMFLDELRHFAACVQGEVPRPLIDGEQGAAVLSIALAALRSAATGQSQTMTWPSSVR